MRGPAHVRPDGVAPQGQPQPGPAGVPGSGLQRLAPDQGRPPPPALRPGQPPLTHGAPGADLARIAPAPLDPATTERLFRDLGQIVARAAVQPPAPPRPGQPDPAPAPLPPTPPADTQTLSTLLSAARNQPPILLRLNTALQPLLVARTPEGISLLQSLIQHPNPEVSLAAVKMVGEFMDKGYPIAFDAMKTARLDHLMDPAILKSRMGGSVVRSLAIAFSAGNDTALAHLQGLVQSHDPDVVLMAVASIDRAIKEGYPLPVDMFDKLDLSVMWDMVRCGQAEVMDALRRAGEGGNEIALDMIAALATGHPDYEVKSQAIATLGKASIIGNIHATNILAGTCQAAINARNYGAANQSLFDLDQAASHGSRTAMSAMAQMNLTTVDPRGLDNQSLRTSVRLLAASGNPVAITMIRDRLLDPAADHASEAPDFIAALATARNRGIREAEVALNALATKFPAARAVLSQPPRPWHERTGRELLPKNFESMVRRRYARYLHEIPNLGAGASSWGFPLRSVSGAKLFCRLPRIMQQERGERLQHRDYRRMGGGFQDFGHMLQQDAIAKDREMSGILSDSGYFPRQLETGDMPIELQGLRGTLPFGVFEAFDTDMNRYLLRPGLALEDVKTVARQGIAALQFTVRVGLVHHDLNPGNIGLELDRQGHVVRTFLCDVGEAGSYRGTGPGAVNPEQLPPAARPRDPREEAMATALLRLHTQYNGNGVNGARTVTPPEAMQGGDPFHYLSPAYDAYSLGVVLSQARTKLARAPENKGLGPDPIPTPDPDPELTSIITELTNLDPAQRLKFLLSYRG